MLIWFTFLSRPKDILKKSLPKVGDRNKIEHRVVWLKFYVNTNEWCNCFVSFYLERNKNSDIFHIIAQNLGCGYSLEPPRRGGSNEYPQSMFWAEIWRIAEFFIWTFSFFGGEIFSIFE